MTELSIGPAEKAKLTTVIKEGVKQLQEIQDIRESLKDLVKAVADELNVKPKEIMKSIRVTYKASLADEIESHANLCAILEATGQA